MPTLTPPITHRNLTAWFVTQSTPTRTPSYAVLEEAMERHPELLHETGNVNQLVIENPGDLDLFIQAGDIVKGGRQDRTIGTDFIVPAHSEAIPIPAFCVEARRWHKRRSESDVYFSKSTDVASSKKLRAAIQLQRAQAAVWNSVAEEQKKLSTASGVSAMSPESPSSLQLSYELEAIEKGRRAFVEAFENRKPSDATGVVWAINGQLSHADLYATPELLGKVWRKLIQAAAIEALAESHPGAAPSERIPDEKEIAEWIAIGTDAQAEPLPPRTRVATRRAEGRILFETFDTAIDQRVHTSVLAL